ncbi:terminase [Staphylococcus haemolyticus]|uniref:phage tail protein n=1 Tax=Staphylococcus haemolyticus TaxID=1283 RepID=UPI001F43050D|nr:terminase [Staphylococcus haemolyticus]MCE5021381.1 terminase [Staphylococcus haemolyticus]
METNFMAKIMANIRDFQNNVRKAQSLAKTSIPDEVETDVKANINQFQRNLQRAKAMAQKGIGDIRSKIFLETDEFKRKKREAQAYLDTMKKHKVELELSDAELMAKYNKDKATIEAWRKHVIKLDLDTSAADMAANGFKKNMLDLQKSVFHKGNWHIDLGEGNIGRFAKQFETVGATARNSLDSIRVKARETWGNMNKALTEYGDKMDALATKIRTFGTIFSQQVRGLMIASIQGLIPVIAGLVPALMAVLNAVGVLAGGILGLAGAFSIAGAGAFAFGGMAISALKMLKDGTLQATAETRRYQASLDQVKSTWESIIKQNQAQIFNTLANGLNTVNVALSRMKPFLAGVSKGMEQASKSVLKWAENSRTASKFFNMMNTTGVKTFNTLLSAAGRFGDGLVNVFTQLGPLFLWVAQGLDSLGKKFQNWANSVAGQNAIKAFIEYTKTNLPKIGQIFGNVFAGIGNLMVAFAQNSSNIFDWLVKLTAQFRAWSEQVGKSEGFKKFIQYVQQNGPVIMQLIGNIVRALVAFGTAMAPIASVILRVVTAFTGFIAKLFETHPAVAKMVGIGMILAGIMWALLAPIIAVGTVLSNVFGVSLLQAIGKIARFMASSNILKGVLNILRGAFSLLVSPIANIGRLLPLLGTAFSALTGPVGIVIGVILALVGVIVYLWKTNEDFRNMIIDAWNGIKDAISGAVQSIIDWFTQLWASIQQTLKPIMPLLQQVGSFIMQVLGGLVMGAIQLVIGAFQSLWLAISVIFTAIGGIISAAVQLIVGLFTAFIQFITGDFSGAWQTLQTTIQNVWTTIWNTIVSIFTQISEFIFNTLNSILGTNITSWSQIWNAIVQYVTQIWNSVTQWFGQMAQSVWNKMVQAYNYVVSTGAQWVSSIINTLARFVSSVISGFIRVVSSVASHMAQALSRVISFGAQWVSAIISAMARFVSGVISGFVRVVNQVQSGMSRAVNTVRNFIGQFVSAGLDLMRGLVQGIMNGMKWVVNAAKNVAQSAVNAAKSVLRIHSPSRVFRGIGQYVSQGLGMGILADQHKAVNAVRSVASNLTDAFKPELSTDLTDGLGGSLNGSVDAHMTKDVRHSTQENNRPIVNITVRNEGDVEYIKSYIEEQNGKNSSMGL